MTRIFKPINEAYSRDAKASRPKFWPRRP